MKLIIEKCYFILDFISIINNVVELKTYDEISIKNGSYSIAQAPFRDVCFAAVSLACEPYVEDLDNK
jgi:hypothetical protein